MLHKAPTHRYSRAILRHGQGEEVGRSPRTGTTRAGPRPGGDLRSRTCLGQRSYSAGGLVHWPIPIGGSPVSTAGWSSSSPRVSRSSMHSGASRSHPSGVLRVAHPARHSVRRGGPARVQARTGGTGSHRADTTAVTPSGAPGRCTRRSAPSVDGPPRCRSSRPALDRSIAATASRASADVVFAVRGHGSPAAGGPPPSDRGYPGRSSTDRLIRAAGYRSWRASPDAR